MAVDAAGNTYLTGSFDGTATFGSTNISSSGGINRPDIFVAKYNSAGLLQWVRKAGGTGTDLAFGIAVDGSSNVVVTGSSDSLPFSICSTNVSVSGKKILFLKFDSNGALLWVRTSLAQALFPPPDGAGTAVGSDAAFELISNAISIQMPLAISILFVAEWGYSMAAQTVASGQIFAVLLSEAQAVAANIRMNKSVFNSAER